MRFLSIYIVVFLSFLSITSSADVYRKKKKGRALRNIDFGCGLIGTGFMGDVGGSKGEGSRFVKDYDFKAMRPALNIAFKYKTNSFVVIETGANMGYFAGSDRYSKNPIRNNRNISFRASFFELFMTTQVYIGRPTLKGLYVTKSTRGRAASKFSPHPYVFGGIGYLFFNPKGKYTDGRWYDLQKLGTEGQGIIPGTQPYAKTTVVIPFGVGVRNAITRYMNLGIEISGRKTFSDYIDDVSGNYYDIEAIRQEYGDPAAYFADPNKGVLDGATSPNADGTYAQRGNNNLDSYFFVLASVNFKLGSSGKSRARF